MYTNQTSVKEKSKIGTVPKNVYFGYIKSGSNLLIAIIFPLLTISAFGAHSFADVWISKWTNIDDLELSIFTEQSKYAVCFDIIKSVLYAP